MKHIKEIIKISAVGLALILAVPSCTDKFDEYNTDKTQPDTKVTEKELAGMLSSGQNQMLNWFTGDNGNRMRQTLIACNTGQEVCLNHPYERYTQSPGWQNSGWVGQWNAYNKFLRMIPVTKAGSAERAIAVVMKVYSMQLITDIWGPIPFDDAGDVLAKEPRYESQRTIYYKMMKELELASGYLKSALDDGRKTSNYTLGDMIYHGDIDSWYRFCNTMWLRMAIRVSKIEPAKAKTDGEKVLATGMFMETPAHSAWIQDWSTTLAQNGMCRYCGQWINNMSNSFESYLKGYNDPRMKEMFRAVVKGPDPLDGIECVTNDMHPKTIAKVGGWYGMPSGIPITFTINNETVRSHSRYGARFDATRALIQPEEVMMAAEAWFLKAEAGLLGWSGAGEVKSNYESGISCSIKEWLPSISSSEINNYINGTTPPAIPGMLDYSYLGTGFPNYTSDGAVATLPVKFSTNPTEQMEQIHIQKWIGVWPCVSESWAERRRTRLPKVYNKKNSDNANIRVAEGMIQTRAQFASDEKTSNRDAVIAAIPLLGKGGADLAADLENIPLWWDTNNNGSVAPGNFSSEPADPIANWNPIAIWER